LLEQISTCYFVRTGRTIYNCLSKIAETLEENEERLNTLDRLAGDGDCGSTLKRAAKGKLHSKNIYPVVPD
jgi:hypothetical protein